MPLEGDDVSDIVAQYRDQLPMHEHMVTMDPPEHTRERALLMRLITPKRLAENEAFVWRLADRQLDELESQLFRQPQRTLLEANQAVHDLLLKAQVDVNEATGEVDPVVKVTSAGSFGDIVSVMTTCCAVGVVSSSSKRRAPWRFRPIRNDSMSSHRTM